MAIDCWFWFWFVFVFVFVLVEFSETSTESRRFCMYCAPGQQVQHQQQQQMMRMMGTTIAAIRAGPGRVVQFGKEPPHVSHVPSTCPPSPQKPTLFPSSQALASTETAQERKRSAARSSGILPSERDEEAMVCALLCVRRVCGVWRSVWGARHAERCAW